MREKPKRLRPSPETLRQLFVLSGNLCAFPNCTSLMMNEAGVFIGQVCHIEAAEPGGPRFNPDMTNEERRASSNLVLMCYEHHRVTDDETKYTTHRLVGIKQQHEHRFSEPHLAILDRLTDWTTTNEPRPVRNLRRMNDIFDWGYTDSELDEAVTELNQYISTLRHIPIGVRQFMGAIARRLHLMRDSGAVQDDTQILAADFMSSHALSNDETVEPVSQMNAYGVGGFVEFHSEDGVLDGISLNVLPSGWPIWPDIVEFCEKTGTPLDGFIDHLDFSALDSS